MVLQKSILLLSNKDDILTDQLENICYKNNFTLFKLYNMIDCISAINQSTYHLVIIDTKYFSAGLEIFGLFKRKNFFVPYIILISDNELEIYDDNVNIVKRDDTDKLTSLILNNLQANKYDYINQQNSFLHNIVEKTLGVLGFSRRYKGFDYMIETVIRILNDSNCKNSFRKYIYPHISVMYHVSEESIERDMRNLISKINNNVNFNFKPTTKNIVNAVVSQVKDYLSKLGNKLVF